MRRRRTKRKRPRKQFWSASQMVRHRTFNPRTRGSTPRRSILWVADAIRQRTRFLLWEFGVRFPGNPFLCPCSSVDLEHLATNQGVGSSNLSRGVWVISSVDLEHEASTLGVPGSNPGWPVGKLWAVSSAGRAPALQAGCHRFDPCTAHTTGGAGAACLPSGSAGHGFNSCVAHMVSQPDKRRPPTGASEILGGASICGYDRLAR
jgi:hypothetical protein